MRSFIISAFLRDFLLTMHARIREKSLLQFLLSTAVYTHAFNEDQSHTQRTKLT